MNVDKTIEGIKRRAGGNGLFTQQPSWHERALIDEDFCHRLAQYFDVETGGECSQARYVQQAICEIMQERSIEAAERRLEYAKNN